MTNWPTKELLVQLMYLWTRDAGVEPFEMEAYVSDRFVPFREVTFTDKKREEYSREIIYRLYSHES